MEPPSLDAFEVVAESPEPMVVVIEGHKALDASLMALLAEALADPVQKELSRLRFSTKVDLVIGLGMLHTDSRPAWIAFDRLRNKMAHRLGATVSEEAGRELVGALGPRHRQSIARDKYDDFKGPLDVAKLALMAIFVEATHRLGGVRDEKVASQSDHEVVVELMKRAGHSKTRSPIDERRDGLVAAAREARKAEGKY